MSTAAFDRMTPDEQVAHVQDLWDRIAARAEGIDVSEAWRDELRRRSSELKDAPDTAIAWADVRKEIWERLGNGG